MEKILTISNNDETYFKLVSSFVDQKLIFQPVMELQDAIYMLSKDEYSAIIINLEFSEVINTIKFLRQVSFVPIITYCSHYSNDAKIELLQNGADECIVESDDFEDFHMSIHALCRRYDDYNNQNKEIFTKSKYHDICICPSTRSVFVNGININLKRREFDILLYLTENKNIVLTYEQIYHHVWGDEYVFGSNNILWCQMHRLTMKINPLLPYDKYIVNVKGFGYQINPKLSKESIIELKGDNENIKSDMSILCIGYASNDLMTQDSLSPVPRFFCQKAQYIQEIITVLNETEISLIIINGDSQDYLMYIKYVRNMTLAPILVTTERYDTKKKLEVIQSGADMYLRLNEFKRNIYEIVEALIRRYREYKFFDKKISATIMFRDIVICLRTHKVFIKGKEVNLSRKEYDILRCILERKGEVLSYEELYRIVWGEKYEASSNKGLMLQVHRLKDKMKINNSSPRYILNIREIGYKLNTEFDG